MKIKKYEMKGYIYTIIILLFILELIGLIVLYTSKIYSYNKMSGIVISEKRIVMMIDKNEKNILYKNQNAYVDNYCKKYKIIENRGKIFTKSKKNYYEIIVEIDFSDKYKPNDIIELSLKDKKNRLIKMFKIIWDGD